MTDTSTAGTRDSGHAPKKTRRGLFARISLFISQILDELRKVVRPTRDELLTYTAVVIVFVSIVMLFVFGLDEAFTRLVALVFGE